jgi:hypothetical protein
MRRATIGILAVSAAIVAGCGGGKHFANEPRPPTPVNLTVYINNSRVLVSPSAVGAGPVTFIITNQSAQAQSVTVQPTAGGSALATTAPINPQATSEVQVNFTPGTYTVGTNGAGGSDAAQASPSQIQSASLFVGPQRENSNSALLQP